MSRRDRVRLEGTIAGAGFASGDRFVVGRWRRGPLGPMSDVMWAQPDGTRVLLAPDDAVARFVGGVYSFDDVRVVPFAHDLETATRLELSAGPVSLRFEAGAALLLFSLRPRLLRRSPWWVRFENVLAKPLVGRAILRGAGGVRAYGTAPGGVREWYCIDAYRPLLEATATLDGRDLGPMRPLDPPMRVGFSEFPRRPALVRCAPVLEGAGRFLGPLEPRDY